MQHFATLETWKWKPDGITLPTLQQRMKRKWYLLITISVGNFFFNSLWFGVQLLNFQNDARLVFQELKKATTQKISQFDLDQETDEIKRMAKFYKSLGNNLTRKQLNEVYTISA